jgi:Zn-dependent protease
MDMSNFNPAQFLLTLFVLVIAITIHEFAHAVAADRLGDSTPRSQGRISLNPMDHLDPIGTLMMAVSTLMGIGIGWGKPVMTYPANFRSPRWDSLKVAVAGPLSNLLQALVFAAILRGVGHENWLTDHLLAQDFLSQGVWINLALALFNIIPIPPLDGSKVLSALLPVPQARTYEQVMGQWGLLLFFLLIFSHGTTLLLGTPVSALYRLFVG